MCITDKYPTEYDLKPIKLNSITDVENKALRIVNTVERVHDPLTMYDVVRYIIKISARLLRQRRKHGAL
tara:strand:- start:4433 stop:4639 length:207 start_codon:yes stop_codon:yes gene_type:complete